MRVTVSTILITAILSYQLSSLLVYMSFKINQEYIAKNLCVEKDVEGSTCKGCCQLKKKIHEQEEQQKNMPVPVDNKSEINFFNEVSDGDNLILESSQAKQYFHQNNYLFFSINSVFHPPRIT